MKNILFLLLILLLTAFYTDKSYIDGNYQGISRSIYTNEPYYGYNQITIDNGMITRVRFFIRDSVKQEYFDEHYEKYFTGNELYIQQCRNDWKGVQSYPDSLLKYQDPDKIDVISGATWSYNIFVASAREALSKASK